MKTDVIKADSMSVKTNDKFLAWCHGCGYALSVRVNQNVSVRRLYDDDDCAFPETLDAYPTPHFDMRCPKCKKEYLLFDSPAIGNIMRELSLLGYDSYSGDAGGVSLKGKGSIADAPIEIVREITLPQILIEVGGDDGVKARAIFAAWKKIHGENSFRNISVEYLGYAIDAASATIATDVPLSADNLEEAIRDCAQIRLKAVPPGIDENDLTKIPRGYDPAYQARNFIAFLNKLVFELTMAAKTKPEG